MKKFIYTICWAIALFVSQSVGAKSMKDLLVSMPDSVIPCLDKNLRIEFVELQEMGVRLEVKNLLGETCVIDTLTDDFVQMRMSKVSSLQMKKLPMENGDSLLCVVKTFAGPDKESELYLFDQEWMERDTDGLFECKKGELKEESGMCLPSTLQSLANSLIQKPDTMGEKCFAQLVAMIEPKIVNALLLQNENAIVVRLSLPLLSSEDKERVNAIRMQRKFKWNGRTFKES